MEPGGGTMPVMRPGRWVKAVLLSAIIVTATATWVAIGRPAVPAFDEAWVRHTVGALGNVGPIALIGIMVLAIVVSPIPSGPIAVAAGALYGVTEGAILSVAGAEIGALIAFSLSRYLGHAAVRRSGNPILQFIAVPRSQVRLMWIVFAARLVPFISFDAISYATGLTDLSFLRFALATAIGVVPICCALATLGAGMADGGPDVMRIVLIAGGITLAPAVIAVWRRWH
ncbi:MAG: TVP38/TMEM64 family protein [Alphaproteobacteria bacterium]|nr:TVP38/TMEM64 family protein [Alphaproteobacteria bacterium]